MVRQSTQAISTLLFVAIALFSGPAAASTPLTRAVVSSLRNQVRLIPQDNAVRKARLADVLRPGDGIATARQSLAELRFNDGSLARMGEQAVFRFVPRTRSFRLSNGTVLMLIPPGQGQTRINTPNVTAGIRGSALIVRYDATSDSTTVIALTNSEISVTNRGESQRQVLVAGQAVVAVGDVITASYDVDLGQLYETSPLLRGLDMNNPVAPPQDAAIAQVRAETLEGLRTQRPFAEGEGQDLTARFRLGEVDVDRIISQESEQYLGNARLIDPTALPRVDLDGERRASGAIAPKPILGVDDPDLVESEGSPSLPRGPISSPPPILFQPPVVQLPALPGPPVVPSLPAIPEPPVALPLPAMPELPTAPALPAIPEAPVPEPPVIAEPPMAPPILPPLPELPTIPQPPVIVGPPVIDDPIPQGPPGGNGFIDLIARPDGPAADGNSSNDVVTERFPASPPPLGDGFATLLPGLPPVGDAPGMSGIKPDLTNWAPSDLAPGNAPNPPLPENQLPIEPKADLEPKTDSLYTKPESGPPVGNGFIDL